MKTISRRTRNRYQLILSESHLISSLVVFSKKKKKSTLENPSSYVKQAIKDNYLNFTLPALFMMLILSFLVTRTEEDNLVLLFVLAVKVVVLLIQKFSADMYAPFY